MNTPENLPPFCSYFVTRKSRHCNFRVSSPEDKYCHHHSVLNQPQEEVKACPFYPNHLVLASKYEKHIKRCQRLLAETNAGLPYHENLNVNDDLSPALVESAVSSLPLASFPGLEAFVEKMNGLYLQHCAFMFQPVHASTSINEKVHSNDDAKPLESNSSPPSTAAPSIPRKIYAHPLASEGLTATCSAKKRKHAQQHASLLGHLEQCTQFRKDLSYLEFGCGKGVMSHLVYQLSSADQYLIDRGRRGKLVDKFIVYNEGSEKDKWHRYVIDIAHLELAKISSLQSEAVCYSKHLCGVATDLTLRCIRNHECDKKSAFQEISASVNSNFTNSEIETEIANLPPKNSCCQVSTVLIALCCHHKCSWQSIVNRQFLQSIGIEEQDFVLLTKLSSWAVDGQLDEKEKKEAKQPVEEKPWNPNPNRIRTRKKKEIPANSAEAEDVHELHSRQYLTGLSHSQRLAIGRMCKRLIDLARVRYLESMDYTVTMVEYVEEEYTLENVLLIAKKGAHLV